MDEDQIKQNRQKKLMIAAAIVASIALLTIVIFSVIKNVENSVIDKEQEDTDIKTSGGHSLQECLTGENIGGKRTSLVSSIVVEYMTGVNEDTKTMTCEKIKNSDVFSLKTSKNNYKLKIEKDGYIEARIELWMKDNTIFEFDTKNYPRKYIDNALLEQYLLGSYIDYDNFRHGYYYAGNNQINIYTEDCEKNKIEYIKNQVKQKIYDLGANADSIEYIFTNQIGACADSTL